MRCIRKPTKGRGMQERFKKQKKMGEEGKSSWAGEGEDSGTFSN